MTKTKTKTDYSLTGERSVFLICFLWGEEMNIVKFIRDHKELNELPFLIVFRAIQVLNDMGMLSAVGGSDNVD